MIKSKNPDFKNYVLEKINVNHFMHFIGFEITKIEEGYVEGEMNLFEKSQQQDGWVHGGITATVADIVMGFAAYTLVAQGERVVTVNSQINYYKAGKGDKILATGRVTKAGSRFHFCESEVLVQQGDEKMLIAKAGSAMAVIT